MTQADQKTMVQFENLRRIGRAVVEAAPGIDQVIADFYDGFWWRVMMCRICAELIDEWDEWLEGMIDTIVDRR